MKPLPTLLIATLCLCVLLTILYYSLVVAWEVFWASQQSSLLLDPSAEVVLTSASLPVLDVRAISMTCRKHTTLQNFTTLSWDCSAQTLPSLNPASFLIPFSIPYHGSQLC